MAYVIRVKTEYVQHCIELIILLVFLSLISLISTPTWLWFIRYDTLVSGMLLLLMSFLLIIVLQQTFGIRISHINLNEFENMLQAHTCWRSCFTLPIDFLLLFSNHELFNWKQTMTRTLPASHLVNRWHDLPLQISMSYFTPIFTKVGRGNIITTFRRCHFEEKLFEHVATVILLRSTAPL